MNATRITNAERTALAMLSSGASWAEAAAATRTQIERLQSLWAERGPLAMSARGVPILSVHKP